MPEPSDNYKLLKDMISNQTPFVGTYKTQKKRVLCPHVLGYKKEDDNGDHKDETVLCWQLADEDDGQAAGWRNLRVSLLKILEDEVDPGVWETPENYSDWQNSVQKTKYNVDYP